MFKSVLLAGIMTISQAFLSFDHFTKEAHRLQQTSFNSGL